MNDAQQPLNALPQGHRLQEYELVRVLGFGGFGMTYLGFDHNLDKAVAIKEYLPSDIATRTSDNSVVPQASQFRDDFEWGLDRFVDEARALARFDHRHVIKVHRFFEAHGTAYIVMEYAEGETLSAFLERKGTLTEAELKAILYPLLDGLEVIHRADFLHRDIKPGNIIIRDEDNSPVLLDFGSARQAISARSRSVTSIITPGYAPIEQYSSRSDQGPWTDIYALGGVCYRALTGQVPDDAPDRMRNDPLVPVAQRCIDQARGEFLSAIDWALAVDEGDRPQSVAEWRAKLGNDLTRHEPGPVSQQGHHQGEKTIDDLPNHPPLEDVQKLLLSVGLADAAKQLGVSAGELDFIRKKYSLRLPKHIKSISRKKPNGKLRAVVLCVVALIVIGVKIYVDRIEEERQEQAALEKQRQAFAAKVGRMPYSGGVNNKGVSDLHIATRLNLPAVIISLLNQGADVNAKTKVDYIIITLSEYILNFDIESGDVNAKAKDGYTPLHLAAFYNAREAADVLLKYRADVNAKNNLGYTPLHLAAQKNTHRTADVLLKYGANVNAKNNSGDMPLHLAVFYNAPETAEVLLKYGADVNAENNLGYTPLGRARLDSSRETIELLRRYGGREE